MLMTDVKREQTQLLQMIEVIVDNDFLQNNRQTDQQW